MSNFAINVENLGKKYLIRHQGQGRKYKALRDILSDAAKGLFSRKGKESSGKREEFWALRDVSFQVEQGSSIGIVGRNGAGKSTLLKLLSRITEPSTGRFELRGRVASLLEVGTGFHPELTGRENIYLNGAILGMGRQEIRKKFDEIVAFSDVEKFLDTPVKRYSSGMYTRLAFAIAANVEPEILIIDEVLAVGDLNFQKKCLAKVSNVSKQGSTVLFVSHNMDLVSKVCESGLLLKSGRAEELRPIHEVIRHYISETSSANAVFKADNDSRCIQSVEVDQAALLEDKFRLKINFRMPRKLSTPTFGFVLYNETDHPVFGSNTMYHPPVEPGTDIMEGVAIMDMDHLPLWSGIYKIGIWITDGWELIDHAPDAVIFDFVARNTPLNAPDAKSIGSVHLPACWRIQK